MHRLATLAAALAASVLAACSADLKLPEGARVSCASDADCPDGYVCRQNQGRCFRAGGDVTAPGLVGSPVVTPERVGATTSKVTVAFTTTEALGGDSAATLTFAGSGETLALAIAEKDAATHAYEATYVPKPASDPEGVADFVATLSDVTGNLAPASRSNAVVFDFTPPGILQDASNEPVVSVTLTPPATSPVRDVTAATVGTGVRVGFATTEFVVASGAGAPVVTLGSGAAAVTFAQVSGNGLSFVYEATLAAGLPDGAAPLSVRLTDLAGNFADASLGTVAISTKTPATPAVGTANAVLFHRVPWGSETTAGAPAFFLKGAAGAAPANATVIAYSAPLVVSPQGTLVGREIGRTTAAADGSFGGDLGDAAPFQLFMGDAPDLYVAAVDAAGNVSDADASAANGQQAALVRDVAWTATLQGKIPGRVFPNPHAFEGREVWTPTLWQFGAKPLATPAQVSRKDGTGASVRGAPSWEPAFAYAPIGYRAQQGAAYDPVRGCRVYFAGQSWDGCDSGFFCSQWESCRGAPWSKPVISDPEGDGNPALGYDLPLVWAGGRGASVLHDGTDLWEWNGSSWRKFVMSDPEGDGNPPARTDHQVAYDEARQRLILFGGKAASNNALLDDVWETDFTSWKKLCTAAPCTTTRPAARSGHQLVYDPVRKVTVLVGGAVASGYDATTWTWDGAAWKAVCSAGACATAAQRVEPGLTFDPGRGKAVLFGGTPSGGFDGRIFEWDGATWTEACTAAPCSTGAKPTGRATPTLYYDADRARTILVGGVAGFGNAECGSNWCGTEWEWDGSTWVQVTAPGSAPPGTRGVTPVYDAARDRVVLFGGLLAAGGYSSDTWLWDGARWAKGAPATIPAARSNYAAAYIPGSNVVAMFGGYNGAELAAGYTWNGTNWTAIGGTSPAARHYATLSPSTRASPGGALLLGGYDGSSYYCDAFEVASGAWTGTATCPGTGPSARYGGAATRATGLAGSPVLLFGGNASFVDQNDLWSFNGTTWTNLSPGGAASATQPSKRTGAGLVFDTARNRALLSGGAPGAVVSNVNCVDDYGGINCHDFWEWNGSAWTRVFPVDLYGDGFPDPNRYEGMTFDTKRQKGVAVVFNSGVGATMDTWWWSGGGTDRPGQLASFGFDAAQVTRAYDVLDLDVSWVGGGSGAPGGTATPGASLQVWDNRGWRTLASSATASPSATATFHWTLSGDAALGAIPVAERKRFMVGDQKGLYLGLVPAAASGQAAGMGEVVTDYVELTVRYRLGP
ncbi:MAG: hypothetical protein U0229_08355 [Anaeromyxobacter sp.]